MDMRKIGRTLGLSCVAAFAFGCGDGSSSGRTAGGDTTGVTSITSAGTETSGAGSTGTGGSTATSQGSDSAGSGTAGESTGTGQTSAMPPKFDVGGAGSGTEGTVCDEVMFQAMAQRPDIVLVLDKSGSMDFNTWQFMGQTMNRWDSLYLTVQSVVTQFDDKADFGAELFPRRNASVGECNADNPITVPVAPMSGQLILSSIPQLGESVAGNTPMGEGIAVAKAHLESIVQPNKPQAVILVADGGVSTSCGSPNSSAEIVNMVSQMAAAGVPTYAVGIDADTQSLQDQLNAIAAAGGTGQFYNAQDGNALLMMMEGIVEGVLSCTLELEMEPEYPGFTKVNVGGMEWPQVNDCNTEHGWIWSVPYTEITLCGDACQALKDTGTADLEFLCPQG